MKLIILGLFLALSCLPPLYAQTLANAPSANTNAAEDVASPAPAGHAPDEVMKRLSDLVHGGKYAEAQQLTTGLLLAYPDDQRLIKAKALLEKSLAAASANATPASNQPTSNMAPAPPATGTTAEQFTGMDKVDYNALIELARQAQQTTDLEQQTTLLKQFMKDSDLFLQKHPTEMLLWQLRAASAISLNDLVAGYDAGQKLLAMGASESNDANLQRLLAQLKNKGWLDKKVVTEFQDKAQTDRYTFLGEHQGTWHTFRGRLTLNDNDAIYEGTDGTIRFSRNEIREISQFHYGVKFFIKNGKDFWFFPYYESDKVIYRNDKNGRNEHEFMLKKEALLLDAIVARWGFVSTGSNDWNRTLKPPTP
ncbi:MAG: hypothetical protein LAN36_03750 [Acidobacteriia bacterium]|nr:hypothetical protein [Terriglobia bacterium]